jgi:hypothetical protein
MAFSDGFDRGYAVVTLTEATARCDFWGFEDRFLADKALPEERWLAGFTTPAGTRHITAAEGPPA